MTVTMVHTNPIKLRDGVLSMDRKFHLGMLTYVQHIPDSICAVNPLTQPDVRIMDEIELKASELPYQVLAIEAAPGGVHVPAHERERLRQQIARSRLVYGSGMDSTAIAREEGVPYIPILEYDLGTKLRIIGAEARNPLRRLVRTVRCLREFRRTHVPDVRGAYAVHCNGYPIFEETGRYNDNRLLYLDSRVRADQIIDRAALLARTATLGSRPLRLMSSGRYERLKGADDVVRIAIECLRRNVSVELDMYGQGVLKPKMLDMVRDHPQIRVHDVIPFPELVRVAHGMDLFVCCNIQNDPSCTYLESMGAGLPIVSYQNRMWRGLAAVSQAGLGARIGDVGGMADQIQRLSQAPARLEELSLKAREFAAHHCFEQEFQKRIDAINAVAGAA